MHRVVRGRIFYQCQGSQLTAPFWRNRLHSSKPEAVVSSATEDLVRSDDNPSRKSVKRDYENVRKDRAWVDKVLYSSYLQKFMPPPTLRSRLNQNYEEKMSWQNERIGKSAVLPPVSFKHFMDLKLEEIEETKPSTEEEGGAPVVQFPFRVTRKTEFIQDASVTTNDAQEMTESQEDGNLEHPEHSDKSSDKDKFVSVGQQLEKHAVDLDIALEDQPISDQLEEAVKVSFAEIGTADPSVPPSNISCGGCGALLHCQDQSIPGYIASEKFKKAKNSDLMTDVCYRCGVLEAHQATLNVNVTPEDYPRIVGKIKEQFAMVLLMVDMTDFPCSVWPGIMDIIGNRRPVMLIGNKVDQLPSDDPDYLKRVEESLIRCVVEIGMLDTNIIHTALISAKTGYGVENLISTIFNQWHGKGDIFILGCTNVGKSSLFNILLQSDLCKPEAADLVQRSTISQWPGTTLNLLKFPMTKPHGWRKALRERRLLAEAPGLKAEEKERRDMFEETGSSEHVVLKGYVGKTFLTADREEHMEKLITVKDIFSVTQQRYPPNVPTRGRWNPNDPEFVHGSWVYDTPGAVNPNQILDLLTLPELMQTLPKDYILPRSFYIKPDMTMFIGGLARLDYEGESPIRYTLFTNSNLPVTMCQTCDADEVYSQATGTKVFGVPFGDKERLAQFPELVSKSVKLVGTGQGMSCADIVLSSMGWVAVSAARGEKFQILVHTPDGRGLFIRRPALLPYAVRFKGKRIRSTFAYLPHKLVAPRWKKPRRRHPQPLS